MLFRKCLKFYTFSLWWKLNLGLTRFETRREWKPSSSSSSSLFFFFFLPLSPLWPLQRPFPFSLPPLHAYVNVPPGEEEVAVRAYSTIILFHLRFEIEEGEVLKSAHNSSTHIEKGEKSLFYYSNLSDIRLLLLLLLLSLAYDCRYFGRGEKRKERDFRWLDENPFFSFSTQRRRRRTFHSLLFLSQLLVGGMCQSHPSSLLPLPFLAPNSPRVGWLTVDDGILLLSLLPQLPEPDLEPTWRRKEEKEMTRREGRKKKKKNLVPFSLGSWISVPSLPLCLC